MKETRIDRASPKPPDPILPVAAEPSTTGPAEARTPDHTPPTKKRAADKPAAPTPRATQQKRSTAADCANTRADADEAFDTRSWARAFRLTAPSLRRCWAKNPNRYRMIRATAALKLKHYAECARVTLNPSSPELERKHKICTAKASQ